MTLTKIEGGRRVMLPRQTEITTRDLLLGVLAECGFREHGNIQDPSQTTISFAHNLFPKKFLLKMSLEGYRFGWEDDWNNTTEQSATLCPINKSVYAHHMDIGNLVLDFIRDSWNKKEDEA